MFRNNKWIYVLILLIVFGFICSNGYRVYSQDNCIPRMVTITVGDNTLGNPMQTFTTELGCVYNVFSDVDGYLHLNTPVSFKNAPYFAIHGEITNVSGIGHIIGYQITKLINREEILYIIVFDTNKFLRLKENQFKVEPIAE